MSKTLDRIGALLAKAESTDSEHERDALMSKAQQLATLAAIDLEAARQRQIDKTKRETPVKKYVVLMPDGVTQLRAHFAMLAGAIAENNDTKMTYYSHMKRLPVNFFGFPSDIEVTELLFASLAVQMKAAADAYIKSGAYKGDTWEDWECRCRECRGWYASPPHTKKVDARVARNQFYTEFVRTIRSRLKEARKDAIEESEHYEGGSTLVLASKKDEVDAFYREKAGRVSSASNRTVRGGGDAGRAGRTAGSNARLSSSQGVGGRAGALTA